MNRDDREDALTLLRQAPVLAACRGEPKSRGELVEATDASRTTIYRTTTALEARGLLEETGDGYQTTTRGRATSAMVDRYVTGIGGLDSLQRLFDLADHPSLAEQAHLFIDATVTVSDASNPYRVVERVVERFEATTRSRGTITSATAGRALDEAAPSLGDKESIERIFEASALEAHQSYGGETFEDALTNESLTLLITDEPLPFTFAIDDDSVSIVGHDPATGLPTVHIESENKQARAWLDTLYNRLRDQARILE